MSTMSVASRDGTNGRSTPQSHRPPPPSGGQLAWHDEDRNTGKGAAGAAGLGRETGGDDNDFSRTDINRNKNSKNRNFARNVIGTGTTAFRRSSTADSSHDHHHEDDDDDDEHDDDDYYVGSHSYDTDASPGWSVSGSFGAASYTPRILVDGGGGGDRGAGSGSGSSDVDARYSFENRYHRRVVGGGKNDAKCGIGGGSLGNASASSSESLGKLQQQQRQRRRGGAGASSFSNPNGQDRAGRHHHQQHRQHNDGLEKTGTMEDGHGSVSSSTVETVWSSSVGSIASPSLRECSTIDSMSPPGAGSGGPIVLPCVPDLRAGSPMMGRRSVVPRDAYEDDDDDDDEAGCVAKGGEECFRLIPLTLSSLSGDWTVSTRSALVDYCDGYEYRLSSRSVDDDGGSGNGDGAVTVPTHVAVGRAVRSAVADWTYRAAKGHLRRTTAARIERSVLPVLRGASAYYNEEEADREIHSDVIHDESSFPSSPPPPDGEGVGVGEGDGSTPTPKKLVPRSPTRSRGGGSATAPLEIRCDPRLKSQLSDVGVALFAPLDGIFDDAEFDHAEEDIDTPCRGGVGRDEGVHPFSLFGSNGGSRDEVEEDGVREDFGACPPPREEPECLFPLSLVGEPPAVLRSSPRVLDEETMQHLVDHALPMVVKMRRWVRAYSLSRDGDSFHMMLRLVRAHKYSLLAVRTTNGDVFGGFADCSWGERPEGALRGRFYGLGQAFLFRVSSNDPEADYLEGRERVSIYRWTGENTYCQLCDDEGRRIAMGGGGEEGCFGLCLEDDFTRGSTGRCATFANEPLTDEREFQILDLEMYGFWS